MHLLERESMALFLQNCLTFPSIIFSGLLIIVIFIGYVPLLAFSILTFSTLMQQIILSMLATELIPLGLQAG